MAKVVTSEGLSDFVQTGKATEVIADQKRKLPGAAPALEIVKTPGTTELSPESEPKEPPKEPPKVEDTGLEPEDHDLAERAKKRIGKKHYEKVMAEKAAAEARAAAEESDRFAENLFNEREEWKRKAEALEREANELKAKTAPKAPESKEPNPEDPKYKDAKGEFDWLQFSRDNAAYAAKKAVEDERISREEEARAKAKAESDAKLKARIEAAGKKYADWSQMVEKSPIMLQNECLQFIARSEYGTDIAYFLAKNPEVAEKIRVLDPYVAIAELGILSDQFRKPAHKASPEEAAAKTVERPGAPAPITPISTNGQGSINVDPAKMSYKELRAYERERARRH
jgi:hypothetical protein